MNEAMRHNVNDINTWDSQDPKANYYTEQSIRDSIVDNLDQIQLYKAELFNFWKSHF
jgi:hypothetical protein